MDITEYLYTPTAVITITIFGILVLAYVGIKHYKHKKALARTAFYEARLEAQRKRKLPPNDLDLPSRFDVYGAANQDEKNDPYHNYVDV